MFVKSRRPAPHTLEDVFPKLRGSDYRQTSGQDVWYNCVAWVFDDQTQWWEPSTQPRKYWPPGIPRHDGLDAYKALFADRGYVECGHGDLEEGYEKVALYVHPRFGFQHVAWRDATGMWLSKLGKSFDIEHRALDVLEGTGEDDYGCVAVFMKRPRRSTRACP